MPLHWRHYQLAASSNNQKNKKLSYRSETALQAGSVLARQRVVHFMHKI